MVIQPTAATFFAADPTGAVQGLNIVCATVVQLKLSCAELTDNAKSVTTMN